MDDKSPNTTQGSIDDLVKELSRPQVSEPPSIPRPSQGSMPVSPKPAPVVLNPSVTVQPQTAPKSATPPSPAPNMPKEYQSSIRTMSDDLNKIKSGQHVQGTPIPRKIESSPATPTPSSPKQVIPPPVYRGPTIKANLGQTEKASTLNVPTSVKPTAPTSPSASPSPASKGQFSVPPTSPIGSSNRNLMLGIVAIGAVALGAAYWYFMIREPHVEIVEPVPTFTPRPSATPVVDALGVVFPDKDGTIILPSSGDPSAAFISALEAQPAVSAGKFAVLNASNSVADGNAQSMDVWGLLDRFLISYPPVLRQTGAKSVILVYGQKESFDAKGKILTDSPISKRLVLVSEVGSTAGAAVLEWEPTMTDSLAGLFGFNKTKNKGTFSDNTYQGITIRFKNFPHPDRSIDHAIIQKEGKNYLVISSSRESMYATVDAFKNPTKGGIKSETIVGVAVSAGTFKTLVQLVSEAGLVDTLNSAGPFTVFAPTDDAFAKIPKATLDAIRADKTKLTSILTYHVISGKVLAKDVVNLTSAKTVQGSSVSINATNGVMINNAKVITPDIPASNGVIHVIDTVLIPQ